jgi:small-conductance mechanosensitive channel
MAAVGGGVLAMIGKAMAAWGVIMGVALFALNILLLREIARTLLHRKERGVKIATALSSSGRLLLLGIALAAIATGLGRDAVLGACGGLLIAQVNLHVLRPGEKQEDR